jgi:hypothetical protein
MYSGARLLADLNASTLEKHLTSFKTYQAKLVLPWQNILLNYNTC